MAQAVHPLLSQAKALHMEARLSKHGYPVLVVSCSFGEREPSRVREVKQALREVTGVKDLALGTTHAGNGDVIYSASINGIQASEAPTWH